MKARQKSEKSCLESNAFKYLSWNEEKHLFAKEKLIQGQTMSETLKMRQSSNDLSTLMHESTFRERSP